MNQILVTGDEQKNRQNFEMMPPKPREPKIPRERKPKKEKQLLEINSVIMFFAICIIVLGVCMVSGSVYARNKLDDRAKADVKPSVSMTHNDSNETVDVEVIHKKGIDKIVYDWNNDKSTEETIAGNGNKQAKLSIPIIGGENTLTITVTDVNGKSNSFSNSYTGKEEAKIEFEPVQNGINIKVKSDKDIDYISYKWDDGDSEKIEVGESEYSGTINIPAGQHKLKFEVVDEDGNKTTKEQTVIGSTEPTIKFSLGEDGDKLSFIVEVEDDTGIDSIEMDLNGKVIEQIKDYGEKKYRKEVPINKDEYNLLTVTVYNINTVKVEKKAKYGNQ